MNSTCCLSDDPAECDKKQNEDERNNQPSHLHFCLLPRRQPFLDLDDLRNAYAVGLTYIYSVGQILILDNDLILVLVYRVALVTNIYAVALVDTVYLDLVYIPVYILNLCFLNWYLLDAPAIREEEGKQHRKNQSDDVPNYSVVVIFHFNPIFQI